MDNIVISMVICSVVALLYICLLLLVKEKPLTDVHIPPDSNQQQKPTVDQLQQQQSPSENATVDVTELPTYRCHKEVKADEIIIVDHCNPDEPIAFEGDARIRLILSSGIVIPVHKSLVEHGIPDAGDYYVIDGQRTMYVKQQEFEAGYTLVSSDWSKK